MANISLCGRYTGGNQRKFDPVEFMQLISEHGFNGYVEHLISPWDMDKEGWYPWPLVNGRYDMTQLNEPWFEQKKKGIREAARLGLWQELKRFDKYHEVDNRDAPRGYAHKLHPFVENNTGVSWPDTSKPIYENWNRENAPEQSDYQLGIQWIAEPKGSDNIVGYNVWNKFGRGIKMYLNAIDKIIDEVQTEFPLNTKIINCYYNEGIARYVKTTVNGQIKYQVKFQIDPNERCLMMYRLMAEEMGVKTHITNKRGKIVRRVEEAVDFKHDLDGQIYWPETVKGWNVYLKPRKLMMEHHGVRDVASLQEFFSRGIPPGRFIGSTDGNGVKEPKSEGEIPAYFKPLGEIRKFLEGKKNTWMDYKVPVLPGWRPGNTNHNMELAIPKMAKGIFG